MIGDNLSPHFKLQNINNFKALNIQKSYNSTAKKGEHQNPILVSVANGEDGTNHHRGQNTVSTGKSNDNQDLYQKNSILESDNKNSTDGKETVNYGTFNLVNMN